ncbi:putative 3-hydroxyacyl-CoA dehydrogenase [Aureobasidium sp. EXF-8845]|nr:putative 3-hydroxyacyl-CoA dehydrogenase [Aureobasidium sp. EXF-8845]KAI4842976.1 putative 3-hydroxyacyl-CoA dehydrogenase [Aureobasidium sp. EXF-8846]
MSRFEVPNLGTHLQGKVIVLTGGALGIGSELVRLLHSHGAHVFFGDVLISHGEALAAELSAAAASAQHPNQQIKFLYTNVQDHLANLGLFDLAFNTCGRVDHAVSVAGINREENIVDKELTLESVRKEPDIDDSLDVNLRAPILFSRIASVYLRQRPSNEKDKDANTQVTKSLTLVSSVAGFTEAPGLAVYSAGKHGVYGLMRALRKVLIKSSPYPIRTNAICPWMTETRMVTGIDADWAAAGLPRNKASDVAQVIAGVMVAEALNGEALYVEGGRAWGIEEGIERTQEQWMGEKQSRDFMKGQEVLGTGENW